MLTQKVMTRQEHRLLQEMNQARTDLHVIGGRCKQRLDEGGDVVDQAYYATELATNQALERLRQQTIRQLERAEARVNTGKYGVCESCNVQIDPDRLDVMPYTTLCVRCQRQIEQQNRYSH